MKRIRNLVFRVVPAETLFPLLLALVWNMLAYYGGAAISAGFPRLRLYLPIDARIPLLPWTVSVYIYSYLFWAVNYLLAARCGERCAYRTFCADFLSKCLSFVFFLVLPCTIDRPEVVGNDIWSFLLRCIYASDAPYNLFPSIHCIASYFSAVGILRERSVPLWYRVFSLLMMLAIFVSTVTTKQHVFLDILGGVVFAAILYRVSCIETVWQTYRRFTQRLLRLIRHR